MNIHNLHQQAEQQRETGNFLDALKLYEEVIVNYQKDQNYTGIVDALQGKFLTYKHLFLTTHDIIFADLARGAAELSQHIAREKHISTARCYFSLGESAMLFDEYEKAASFYRNSLEEFKDDPSIGDVRYHLGEALYRAGNKKEGKEVMLAGLQEIQKKAEKLGSFIKNVWESGCHMRLAQLLKSDSPEEAKYHLDEAKKIIDYDERLILRKAQLAELMKQSAF